ncbi:MULTISPECIES: WXG100 family type VII secretion target [unclassified Nocardioides]|uniref:WXG100 family type VII secretion target n=1 Tax=unclassified Nocardioides TaxID=2615069 RepID=UPI0036143ACA
MTSGAPEMGQGEGTLTKAAGMVAEARQDFLTLSKGLEGQIAGVQGKWAGAGGNAFFALHQAWTQKQAVITNALNEFEASLTSTEKDNMATDDTQSANFNKLTGRLG